MRQAIETKFYCPSNVKGSRYSASCDAGRVILDADHSLGFQENHIRAAKALASKLGWDGVWSGGATKGGYAFVQAAADDFCVSKVA